MKPVLSPEDIRDIRAPFAIPVWWHWPLVIALAAIAAIALVILVRAWQKRRAAELTPLERARRALLIAEMHARAGRSHEWADVVAETMRSVLAVRLGSDVLPQTTTELAGSAWAQYMEEAPNLIELLETCDLTRFAQANLDVETLVAKTSAARDLASRLFVPPTPVMS